jgi:class 3 adenylate cyclase
MKEQIASRVRDRSEKLGDRLENISSGRTAPKLEGLRLNEAKEYRLGIVFVDINSFSDYVFSHSEQEVLNMLGLFIPEIIEIVRDYSGYFEKNTGDGVLAYFGAEENDVDSVTTLLDYLATVKWTLANQINPILDKQGIDPISISAGATYGTTFVSRIGVKSGKQRMNRLTAVSEIANIASRLEESANQNEYLVGSRIEHLAQETSWDGKFEFNRATEYEWRLNSEEELRPFLAYNFTGEWESTNSENLERQCG